MVELHEVLMNCLLIVREIVLVFADEVRVMELKRRRVKKRDERTWNADGFLRIQPSMSDLISFSIFNSISIAWICSTGDQESGSLFIRGWNYSHGLCYSNVN